MGVLNVQRCKYDLKFQYYEDDFHKIKADDFEDKEKFYQYPESDDTWKLVGAKKLGGNKTRGKKNKKRKPRKTKKNKSKVRKFAGVRLRAAVPGAHF